uniref:Uncharacterized protein n=1 Tax=Octopus bimaculoides TaxID=37653 RepID=A0A0L8GLR9_OCTBM
MIFKRGEILRILDYIVFELNFYWAFVTDCMYGIIVTHIHYPNGCYFLYLIQWN